MEYAFLSVCALCASALYAFRMHLGARPDISRAEYDLLTEQVKKLTGRLDKLNMAGRT